MDLVKQHVKKIIGQLSLEEKLAQLGSYWMYDLQTNGELDQKKIGEKLKHGIGQITRIAGASTLDPVNAAKAANRLQKFLIENTQHAIPAIVHEECCSGAMILGGTMFPQMLGLASTFRPALAETMTSSIRRQLRAIGAQQGLAPVLDVSRDTRWGRVEETFGEDPTLVSHFGMAYIKGLQGDNLRDGIMATGKHFVGHSQSQGGLNCGPVHLGWHDVYDIFLMPFQAAIRDAKLASMMNAYPELDGEVVAASRRILTDLLRGELGFDGIVVSDYEAVLMIHNFHNLAADTSTAGRLALTAGIDVELPTIVCYGDPLKAALEVGDLNLETIDLAVSRHLQKKIELGLFENPYVDEDRVLEVFETPENRTLAREIAVQSMVLLKNDGLLPLSKSVKTLAVIGPNADNGRNQLGDYSYAAVLQLMQLQKPADSSFVDVDLNKIAQHDIKLVTLLDGIKASVSSETKIIYALGCQNLGGDTSGFDEAIHAAKLADAVVLVLGDHSGLVPSCTTGETRDSADLKLPGVQEELAREIIAVGKPVAAVLINGRPFAMPWLAENANAILEAWLPGEEGGPAVADVLFGDQNPGGKLPISFPRSVGQVPVFYNAKPSGMRSNWYVDYVSEKTTPLYSFGYGLSYTRFEYSELSIDRKQVGVGEVVNISLTIENVGKVAGDEVVQLYVRDEYASMPRPIKELRGYQRIPLKPGEKRTATFHLPVDQLAFYDVDLKLCVESGRMLVMAGGSSDDIRLHGEFEIAGDKKSLVKDRVFVCPVTVT